MLMSKPTKSQWGFGAIRAPGRMGRPAEFVSKQFLVGGASYTSPHFQRHSMSQGLVKLAPPILLRQSQQAGPTTIWQGGAAAPPQFQFNLCAIRGLMTLNLMSKPAKSLCALILFAALTANCAGTKFEPLPPERQTFIHDPSTIVKDGNRFYIFGTGPGIRTKSSPDLIHWTNGESVFTYPPAWTTNAVPGYSGQAWAPDVIHLNGKFYLYYAVSTWGKQVSAIGLATSPTLDRSATNYFWTDCGPVITSGTNSPFNAIDPAVMLDTDSRLWLAFGSYWQGIYLTQLDAKTG